MSRKKKNQAEHRTYENVEYPYEDAEIATFDELAAEQQAINPVILGRLDDSELNKIEEETCADDEMVKKRAEFILNNYRYPPPYPGKSTVPVGGGGGGGVRNTNVNLNAVKSAVKNNKDTPLLSRLLNDKQLNAGDDDNASMNNFWHTHNDTNLTKQQQQHSSNGEMIMVGEKVNDKLVDRTNNHLFMKSKSTMELPTAISNSGELYEQRRQYYAETLSHFDEGNTPAGGQSMIQGGAVHDFRQQDSLSEIFPERDYDIDEPIAATSPYGGGGVGGGGELD